jgi:hypothetical protein
LNDAAVVRRVSESLVPLALNANRIPEGEAGDFFRTILHQTHWPQGVWVVTADGQVLSFHYFREKPGENWQQAQARWKRETLEAIEAGLKAFAPIEPRKAPATDPLPFRGCCVRPDGSVRLAVASGFIRNGHRYSDPAIDSIELPAAAWAAFRPPLPVVGTRWPLPESTAKSFAKALGPLTDSLYTPRPTDATAAELRGEVEAVSGAKTLLRFTGRWETTHDRDGGTKALVRCSASAEGLAEYDADAGQIEALLFVFRGTFRGVPPWDDAKAMGAVVEWRRAAAPPGSR